MTIVRIGRKNETSCMEFEFEHPMDAFVFYSTARDTYREDDFVIDMTEEGDTDERI